MGSLPQEICRTGSHFKAAVEANVELGIVKTKWKSVSKFVQKIELAGQLAQ